MQRVALRLHKYGKVLVGTHVLWLSFLTGKRFREDLAGISDDFRSGRSRIPTALRTLTLLSFGVHGYGVEKSWNLQFAAQYGKIRCRLV